MRVSDNKRQLPIYVMLTIITLGVILLCHGQTINAGSVCVLTFGSALVAVWVDLKNHDTGQPDRYRNTRLEERTFYTDQGRTRGR